jgi:flavin-dependent dehydrogenase
VIAYHKITGERISGPEPVPIGKPTMTLNDGSERVIPFNRHHRPKFVAALLAQVKDLGIEVTFGAKVTDYFEDIDKQKAGIVFESGETIEADIVIAADGIGTKSNKLVNGGQDDRAYSSGISIFRTSFPVDLALADPEVRDRWPLLDGNVPCLEIWGGWVLYILFLIGFSI